MSLALRQKAAFAASTARSATSSRGLTTVVRAEGGAHINPAIKKDAEKVVDILKVEDLPKKAVFCRCWRSGTFPNCDGSHMKHNKATGDNVGPLIVEKAA